VIPVGIFLLTLDTALFGWVGFEDVEGHMARVAEIFRGSRANAALVLGKGCVGPMELVSIDQ
jgi:hypothetical protein